jgi:hypothetical protein
MMLSKSFFVTRTYWLWPQEDLHEKRRDEGRGQHSHYQGGFNERFGPSSSGKTIIIASSEGNQSVPDRDGIKIGLNVYKKK